MGMAGDLFAGGARRRRVGYPEEFERLWRLWNSYQKKPEPKDNALKAWVKTAKARPENDLLHACVEEYFAHLKSEAWKGKMMLSTFLSPRCPRWDEFLDAAEERLKAKVAASAPRDAAQAASLQTWAGQPREKIMAQRGITEAVFGSWFAPQTFVAGEPPAIICTSKFTQNWLENNYREQIDKAFGELTEIRVSQ